MRTYSAKPQDVERKWWVLDAEGKTLGRLSSEVAKILQGKHKPTYTRHIDTGDVVVVINADKVHVTGAKEENKIYYRHTGYPGGIKQRTVKEMRAVRPIQMIELAVKKMLPKGPLGHQMRGKLKVYAGTEHPHAAQQPQPLVLDSIERNVKI